MTKENQKFSKVKDSMLWIYNQFMSASIAAAEVNAVIKELLAEIDRAAAEMSWRKVADGLPEPAVPVLVYLKNEHGKHRRLRAQHVPRYTVEAGHDEYEAGEYCEKDDCYYLREGWYETNEYEEVHWAIGGQVTHWMPLPEAPIDDDPGLVKEVSA